MGVIAGLPAAQSAGAQVVRFLPRPQARVRLICFPHAGATDSVFAAWSHALPAEIEVGAVRKPALSAYPQLVPVLTDAVLAAVSDAPATPFVLFGHSLGSLLAFGVARELRQRQVPQPCCLLCASASAPQRPIAAWPGPPPQEWTITELAAYLRAIGGTPEAVLDNATLLQRLLPRMQVDLAVRASFTYSPSEPPLAYPLAVFGGQQDASTSTADLAAWGEQTSAPFSMYCFAGGHLFLHEQATRQGFLQALAFEAMRWEGV